MKKIITLIAFISSVYSQAQHINYQRFLVDAGAGYGIVASLDDPKFSYDLKNEMNAEDLSGVLFEMGAYYRVSFDSRSLVGIKTNYTKVDAENHNLATVNNLNSISYINIQSEREVFFIGPSYMYEVTSYSGKIASALSLTPGLMMANSIYTESNKTETKLNASGFGLNFLASASYKIAGPLAFYIKVGGTYANISKFDLETKTGSYFEGSENRKLSFIRIEPTLGFRLKI